MSSARVLCATRVETCQHVLQPPPTAVISELFRHRTGRPASPLYRLDDILKPEPNDLADSDRRNLATLHPIQDRSRSHLIAAGNLFRSQKRFLGLRRRLQFHQNHMRLFGSNYPWPSCRASSKMAINHKMRRSVVSNYPMAGLGTLWAQTE